MGHSAVQLCNTYSIHTHMPTHLQCPSAYIPGCFTYGCFFCYRVRGVSTPEVRRRTNVSRKFLQNAFQGEWSVICTRSGNFCLWAKRRANMRFSGTATAHVSPRCLTLGLSRPLCVFFSSFLSFGDMRHLAILCPEGFLRSALRCQARTQVSHHRGCSWRVYAHQRCRSRPLVYPRKTPPGLRADRTPTTCEGRHERHYWIGR